MRLLNSIMYAISLMLAGSCLTMIALGHIETISGLFCAATALFCAAIARTQPEID